MTTFGGIEQGAAPDPDHARGDSARPSPGLFDGVRRQGIRRGRDRWLGGVASGIAHRAGVPPFAVRAVFVVLALFSGLGLFAYGLAWALLPEEDGRIHAEELGHGHWSAGMTGALIMTLLGLSDTGLNPILVPGGNWWFLWPLLWLAAVAAVPYVIRSHGRSGTSSSSRSEPGPAPVPGPRQHRSDDPGKPFVAVVSGMAVIVASVALFLGSAGVTDLGSGAVAVAWAAAAAVLGLGIVVAGLRGRRPGILSFLAVVALIPAALTGLVNAPGNLAVGRISNWAPESMSQLTDGYSIAAGTGELDLRSLAAAGPLPSDITLPVNVAASTVAIQIPSDIPVRVNSQVAFGTVQYHDGGRSTGIWNPEEHTYNPGAQGGTLVLDLQGAFSTINLTGPP